MWCSSGGAVAAAVAVSWRLHLVILWLLGGCIGGSLIINKSTFGLGLTPADSQFLPDDYYSPDHQSRSSAVVSGGGVKYLHSPLKLRDSHHNHHHLHNHHNPNPSQLISSGTSSLLFTPGGSPGGSTSSGSSSNPSMTGGSSYSHNQHRHSHNHFQNRDQHQNNEWDNNDNLNLDNNNNDNLDNPDGNAPEVIMDIAASGEVPTPILQEKLRSSKSSPSSSSSSSTHSDSNSGSSHLNIGSTSSRIPGESDLGLSESGSGRGDDLENSADNSEELGKLKKMLYHQEPKEQQEKLLLQQLMRGYERDVRPVRNANQSVVVKVGITLTQIFDMDEKNQVLTTNVWLDQEWNDEMLRWDPEDFNGLEMIRLPCDKIWLPDVVLYNNADDYTRGYMPSRAMVKYDGNVFWPPPTKFRSTCAVDVTYFPFDDQTCKMKLGSWTYNGYQVDVTNRTAEIDLDNYVKNGEWDLLRADIKRNVVVYPCCPEPFPDVTITIVIRRKTLYYIYNIVLPCMMLSALTLLVFCLPPDSGEKIALGITVLLAFSVFMLAISEALPETSESIPLIGIYLTAVMAITSISVIVTVVVLNLHYLGPRVRPVPAWLKCLLPEDDANFIRQKSMLIPATHRHPRSGSLKRGHVYMAANQHQSQSSDIAGKRHQFQLQHQHGSAYLADGDHDPDHDATATTITGEDVLVRECSSTESVSNPQVRRNPPPAYDEACDEKEGHFRRRRHHNQNQASTSTHSHSHNNALSGCPVPPPATTLAAAAIAAAAAKRGGASGGTGSISGPGGPTADKDNPSLSMCEDLVNAVRYLMNIQEQVESQNVLVAEWRLVAQAVDRILFWIFATMTIVSSTVLLLILPLYKRSTYYGPDEEGDASGLPEEFNDTATDGSGMMENLPSEVQ